MCQINPVQMVELALCLSGVGGLWTILKLAEPLEKANLEMCIWQGSVKQCSSLPSKSFSKSNWRRPGWSISWGEKWKSSPISGRQCAVFVNPVLFSPSSMIKPISNFVVWSLEGAETSVCAQQKWSSLQVPEAVEASTWMHLIRSLRNIYMFWFWLANSTSPLFFTKPHYI